MPENEFEKQVQQKMDELQFAPSAAAWEKVEKQIADKQRRRRVFLWLPLFVLVVAGTTWIYTANHSTGVFKEQRSIAKEASRPTKKTQKEISTQTSLSPTTETVRKAGPSMPKKNSPRLIEKNPAAALVVKKQTQSASTGNMLSKEKTASKKTSKRKFYNQSAVPLKEIADEHAVSANERAVAKKTRINKEEGRGDEDGRIGDNKVSLGGTVASTDKQSKDLDSSADREINNRVSVNNESKEKTIAVKNLPVDSIRTTPKDSTQTFAVNKTAKANKRKWEWGISFAAGSSQVSQGFPIISAVRVNALSYSSTPQNNGGNMSNGVSYTSPSVINNHFAWSVAVLLQKPIGRTWKLNTGINYTSYATGIAVGGKIPDSTGANRAVYRNGRSSNYTNHIHFIELPLAIEKQLGIQSRFSLNAGLAFAILAGTNQLQFDSQANLYYTDRSALDKTQWSLSIGLNYRLLQKALRVETGPMLNYHLGNTFNKDTYGNGHWFFAGIHANIFFGKGKK